MPPNSFEILIASLPDREKVVAEIWFGEFQFAEISRESEELAVQVFPHPRGAEWLFKYADLMEVLAEAGRSLQGLLVEVIAEVKE